MALKENSWSPILRERERERREGEERGTMDPELTKPALEQISGSPPRETARIPQQVPASDSGNVNSRCQAYNELGGLEDASSDSSKAREISPEDETIKDAISDFNGVPRKESGDLSEWRKIEEEVDQSLPSCGNRSSSSAEFSASQPIEAGECSQSSSEPDMKYPRSDAEYLHDLGDDPEAIRLSQSHVLNSELDSLAALGRGGIPAELIKTATDMISDMEPEELHKMLEVAFSLNVEGPSFSTIGNGSRLGFEFPEMTTGMIKMASDRVSKMSPEELQKMLEVPPSFNMDAIFSPRPTTYSSTQRSKISSELSAPTESSATGNPDTGGSNFGLLVNSKLNESSSSLSTWTDDLQENMRRFAKDPTMQQMFTSMMKDMSPEMMTNMSEQLGLKLSMGEADNAQQTMSSISEDDSDIMPEERSPGGVTMEKTTIWFLGKAGLNLAFCMVILAFIFHKLGYIRG